MRIILASKSPRRKKLLKQLGLNFEIIPSNIEEITTKSSPDEIVEELAYIKAKDISDKNHCSLVIGADTIVVKDGIVLGKPKDVNDASEMLNMLSGKQHFVYTGVAIIHTDPNKGTSVELQFSAATKVYFSKLEQAEINAYIETGVPMDKAGSYGIQDDWGATFVEKIEGDFYNVVGLPINMLYRNLKTNFPEILKTIPIQS